MSDQPHLQEAFPLEIEEIIFSLAVQTDWPSAKNLILVAKRVYQWLIPQIYEVVVFHGYRYPLDRPRSDSRNLVHHGKYVHHIMLFNGDPRETRLYNRPGVCLTWCPNAYDVALWLTPDQYDKTLVDQLIGRRLTHLSFSFNDFKTAAARYPDISQPISFPYVTHLELINNTPLNHLKELKESFPALTHLAVKIGSGNQLFRSPDILRTWNDQIQVLSWDIGKSVSDPAPEVLARSTYQIQSDDPRIVILAYGQGYVDTWYEDATGGSGRWRVAEETITGYRGLNGTSGS
ncbi:hypothetical protein BDN72DRAFT_851309 [Pluteus cervinus]|uniref:Uncharacterized protein n=1 Tax=Pluteus cervinus TaxID=181527 RepID=A0ACD3A3E6_9AGAR|nr:hypothetical protein BDN72DRAFT_851309 [Pluteus cervinus]